MRRIAPLLGALLVMALFGVGGWYLWTLRRQGQAMAHRLATTHETLQSTQETLSRAEAERSELVLAYDELKGRLAKADTERAQLQQASTRMASQMATLTSDRTALTKQLDDVTQQAGRLDEQITTLEADYAAVEAEKAALEQQLEAASSAALPPAEVQRLTQAVESAQDEAARLREQMVVLSRAYEELVRPPIRSAVGSAADARRSAQRYRRLGDAYLAAYQYPKAANAYEQALALREAPDLHTRLAFLYSRLLHNPTQAQRHLAAASPTNDPSSTTLGVTPGAQGLPRTGWRLLWSWLTQ